MWILLERTSQLLMYINEIIYMWCHNFFCLLLTMSNESRIAHAQPSQEQRKLQHESTLQTAEALQQDIYNTLDQIQRAVERLSCEHTKSEAFILKQLHLGGNVLKHVTVSS